MLNFLTRGPGILLILLVIMNFISGGLSSPATYFYSILISLPGIIIGLSFHEFAHAYVSYKLGDPTPKAQGRLTLDPRAHIDPYGFIALIFCGFGWGQAVQINPRFYKNRKRGELLVGFAGIVMNLILAVVFALIIKIILILVPTSWYNSSLFSVVINILLQTIVVNLTLAVFNLIPVPPLDGFGILTQILDLKKYNWYYTLYNNGMWILLLLLLFGIVSAIISPIISWLYNLLLKYIILL